MAESDSRSDVFDQISKKTINKQLSLYAHQRQSRLVVSSQYLKNHLNEKKVKQQHVISNILFIIILYFIYISYTYYIFKVKLHAFKNI